MLWLTYISVKDNNAFLKNLSLRLIITIIINDVRQYCSA